MYSVITVRTFHEICYSKMLKHWTWFFPWKDSQICVKSDVSKGFGLWELTIVTIKRSQTRLAVCCDCPLEISVGFSLKYRGLQMETSAAMVISASLTLRWIDTEKYLKPKGKMIFKSQNQELCFPCVLPMLLVLFVCWVFFPPHHILGFRERTHLLVVIKPVCYMWAIFLLQLHERMWLLRPLMLFLIQ